MRGAVQPASRIRCLISGTAAAASVLFTVTRTISDPAAASSTHCAAVAAASAVSVIVIDCTTTGAPPPTWTCPTFTPTVRKLILEEKDSRLPDLIRMSTREGMQDFTMSLKELVDRGLVSQAVAVDVAPNPESLKMVLKGIEVSQPGIL